MKTDTASDDNASDDNAKHFDRINAKHFDYNIVHVADPTKLSTVSVSFCGEPFAKGTLLKLGD